VDSMVIKKLDLECGNADLADWIALVNKEKNLKNEVTIALVGKYVELRDAYKSVAEALGHGGLANDTCVHIKWIHSEEVNENNYKELLNDIDGIIIPGGFGNRGIEGKILSARYARENKVPYFGICLGMQIAVIEYARNVLNLKGAHSTELDEKTPYGVIHLMSDQADIDEKGGTMRLGLYPCKLYTNTKAIEAYGDELIFERHRHRYEFNNEYREMFAEKDLVLSGLSPDERLVEMVELKNHPWFVGCQFHPELKSRPNKPHPLFREFIKAVLENK
jgi:CTP synthase